MSDGPSWHREGRDWPNRAASRFVETPGLTWHVQVMGQGPVALLLHGTGAATHSWRDVMPQLAQSHTVIAPDLPGHGFTRGRPRQGLTLPGMAGAIVDLLHALDAAPAVIAGHSAGAAIALQWAHDTGSKAQVIALNPALMPFPGLAARLFPLLARMLFVNPLMPRMLAGIARIPGETERFLQRSTASRIGPAGLAGYAALLGQPRHCAGALEMMVAWDLETFSRLLPAIANPVLLLHSDRDMTVPVSSVRDAGALLPKAWLEVLPNLGHLAHEERPDLTVAAILNFAQRTQGVAI